MQSIQECFEKRDIPMLQREMDALPKEEAAHHLKRCVDSGLWVPNAADLEGGDADPGNAEAEEEIYEEVKEA